jgi:hypothetical protein
MFGITAAALYGPLGFLMDGVWRACDNPVMAGRITGKSQKGQQVPNMTETEAREHIEKSQGW